MYNEKYMILALKEAKKAFKHNEVPVGAVIVKNDKILAKSYNKKNKYNNSLYHAEIVAIKKATKKLKNWRLEDCDIYVTLEPCTMCASLIHQSRISNIFFGTSNLDKTSTQISNKIYSNNYNNCKINVYKNMMDLECKKILNEFFKKRRK